MNNELLKKTEVLTDYLKSLDSVAICFSGGVDSTYLLYAARSVLKDKCAAITLLSPVSPKREREKVEEKAAETGAKLYKIEFDNLKIEEFAANGKERCYYCKKTIFSEIKRIAAEKGFSAVAEGSNADDVFDYRPGMRAVSELGVFSPLKEAGLTKEDVRTLSREAGLSTADEPSLACLASRIPYGERITAEKLKMVDEAEEYILSLGVTQVRVRSHGKIARIEIPEKEFPLLTENGAFRSVEKKLLSLGFDYVTLDLGGYRTGSMNVNLTDERK